MTSPVGQSAFSALIPNWRGCSLVRGLGHRTFLRLKKLYFFGLKMRRLSRDPFVVCSYQKGSYREDRFRLFLEVQCQELRGHKHKTWDFFTREKEKIFYCESGQSWKRGSERL